MGKSAFSETIKIGYFILPPHQYIVNGQSRPTGAAIRYFETVASKVGNTVEWIGPFPLLRLGEKLKSGEVDGTVGFNKFPELEQFLEYTSTPMFFARPILAVRKENSLEQIDSIDDIEGWRIGIISTISGTYTPLIDNHSDIIALEPLGHGAWAESNINKLIHGRVDAVFERNQFTLPFVAAKMKVNTQIKILYVPDPPTPMYVAFSKASKRHPMLTKKYNTAIAELNLNYEQMAQKEIDKIANK